MTMRVAIRTLITTVALLGCSGATLLATPSPAAANTKQVAIIEDDIHLLNDPVGTLQTFRALGAQLVRVWVTWSAIAPNPFSSTAPPGFDGSDPNAYPAGAWDRWDAVDRAAQKEGLALEFVLTGGAPHWADGPGMPELAASNPNRAWWPNASLFAQFVTAVGRRYGGGFDDPDHPGQLLPRVHFWSIWNEPNFGEDLAPQAVGGSRYSVAPYIYRKLVGAAWKALKGTGHGHDRIIIGSLAARGMTGGVTASHPEGLPGNFAQTKPLQFIRTLYCLDGHLRPLRGNTAKREGCPTTSAGTSSFRAHNPGLFQARGFADHPYPQDKPPTQERSKDPDFTAFNEIPRLEGQLDAVQRFYRSGTRFPIYNDEYGYITHPPNTSRFVSPSTAAYYLNWAEYLSWRQTRIASTMQYLLSDPAPSPLQPDGGFASGLLTSSDKPKATYGAYRMPLFLPTTKTYPGRSVEVWGCVRPAPYAAGDTHTAQYVQVQLEYHSRGSFKTIQRVKVTNTRGYFDVHVRFPSSGMVRLQWSYPASDPRLPTGTITSRYVHLTIH